MAHAQRPAPPCGRARFATLLALRAGLIALVLAGLVVLVLPGVAQADGDSWSQTTQAVSLKAGVSSTVQIGTLTENCQAIPGSGGYNCGGTAFAVGATFGDGGSANIGDPNGDLTVTPVDEPEQVEGDFASQLARGAPSALPVGPIEVPCDQTNATWSTCTFDVDVTHTYASIGDYTIEWSWSDTTSGASGTNLKSDATVSPDFTLNAAIDRSGNTVTVTGTFDEGNLTHSYCDYTVEVDWGDGSGDDYTSAHLAPQGGVAPSCGEEGAHRSAGAKAAASGQRPELSGTNDDGPTFNIVTATPHTYGDDTDPSNPATVTIIDNDDTDGNGNPYQVSETIDVAHIAQVTTGEATLVGPDSAHLAGTVLPNGGTLIDCHFNYGTGEAFGSTAPCTPGSFTGLTTVGADLSGLQPSTKYYFDLEATTSVGKVFGGEGSFYTTGPFPPGGPHVFTGAATNLQQTSATLSGQVDAEGASTSDCHFEYGITTSYGSTAPCVPAGVSGSGLQTVTAGLTGLDPGTTYHFRLDASNPGVTPASQGADVSFQTLPDCNVQVKFSYLEATGCLAANGDGTYTSTPDTKLDIDGITVVPDGFVGINLNPATRTVTSSSTVTLELDHQDGESTSPVVLYDGELNWTIPQPSSGTAQNVKVTTFSLAQQPDGTTGTLDGMQIDGDLTLNFTQNYEGDFTGNAFFPVPAWLSSVASALNLAGAVDLKTKPGIGVLDGSETASTPNFNLFPGVKVSSASLTYDPVTDVWSGTFDVAFPTPQKLDVHATLAFQHGKFHYFDGGFNNANIPITAGIYVQNFDFGIGENPFTLNGSLGLSWGPQVSGASLVQINGGFKYVGAVTNSSGQLVTPETLNITGNVNIAKLLQGSAYFTYYDYNPGSFKFGAKISPVENKYLDFNAEFDGAVQGSSWDLDAQAGITLKFIDVGVNGEVLLSDEGWGACASVSYGFGSVSAGIGKTWGGSWDLMWHGCSVSEWQTLSLGSTAAAGAVRRYALALKPGNDMIEVDGHPGTAPRFTLTGPGGRRITVPRSRKPYATASYVIYEDPTDGTTWVAIGKAGGSWHVTADPGQAITHIRSGALLPPAKVTGKVTGKGAKRTVSWRTAPVPGQKIELWERGKGYARLLKTTTESSGSLTFDAAGSLGGARTISAQLVNGGLTRADVVFAHFTAPRPGKLGKVTKLAAAKAKGGVKVSWKPAANAADYLVTVKVTKGDGATLTRLVDAPAHSVTVNDIDTIGAARVSVQPLSLGRKRGRAVSVMYPAPKKKR